MKHAAFFISWITIFLLAIVSCGTMKTEEGKQKKSIQVEGIVVQEQFINKGGKEIDGVFDFFLGYGNQKRFIKLMESKVSADDLLETIGKTASFEIIERHGLWDTDDPNVQSRVGDYVVILKIVH